MGKEHTNKAKREGKRVRERALMATVAGWSLLLPSHSTCSGSSGTFLVVFFGCMVRYVVFGWLLD